MCSPYTETPDWMFEDRDLSDEDHWEDGSEVSEDAYLDPEAHENYLPEEE